MKKKSLIALVIALIVVLLVLVWVAHNRKARLANATLPPKNAAPVSISQIDSSKLPGGFPSEIPLETGANVSQNYTALGKGSQQATREFTSQKSLDDNYSIYSKFFSSNGWTVSSSLNQPTLKVISATKQSLTAQVVIQKDSKSQNVLVNISVITPTAVQ